MEEFGRQFFEVSDVDEEFRSCCEEDEHWLDTEEYLAEGEGDEEHKKDFCECSIRRSEVLEDADQSLLMIPDDGEQDVEESSLTFCEGHDEDASEFSEGSFDEFSVRIFFKGVSVYEADVLGSRVSGIGVVMEKPHGDTILQVQKKLEFFVKEVVAEHLALMDGLLEAMRNGFRNVFAFTDSDNVYRHIAKCEEVDDRLLAALGERIHELADTFELFVLRLAPCFELERPLQLAKEATGILGWFIEKCTICGEEKYHSKMIVLPSISNVSFERESTEIEMRNLCRFYCPYSDCSVLFSPSQWSTSGASSSVRSDNSCIECHACGRLVCASHEFCFSCGAEFRNRAQISQCKMWDETSESSPASSEHEMEPWRWDRFNLLPATIDGFSQEKSQLALIQRFIAGDISLDNRDHCNSSSCSSDSYQDTIKDLNQLPWLERFVSAISDSYHEDYIF